MKKSILVIITIMFIGKAFSQSGQDKIDNLINSINVLMSSSKFNDVYTFNGNQVWTTNYKFNSIRNNGTQISISFSYSSKVSGWNLNKPQPNVTISDVKVTFNLEDIERIDLYNASFDNKSNGQIYKLNVFMKNGKKITRTTYGISGNLVFRSDNEIYTIKSGKYNYQHLIIGIKNPANKVKAEKIKQKLENAIIISKEVAKEEAKKREKEREKEREEIRKEREIQKKKEKDAADIALWNKVKDENNYAAYKNYIDQFPNGIYYNIAKNKIKIPKSTFTDSRDGKVYKTFTINGQTWMAQNLAYEKRGAYYDKYGYLYTIKIAKKVCPSGWHLPSKYEFNKLLNTLGDGDIDKNYNNLIQSAFSAKTSRKYYSLRTKQYKTSSIVTTFWSSSIKDESFYYSLTLHDKWETAYVGGANITTATYVRCLKD